MREGFLWVLEENHAGRAFYETHGYRYSGERKPFPDTETFLLRYTCFFLSFYENLVVLSHKLVLHGIS